MCPVRKKWGLAEREEFEQRAYTNEITAQSGAVSRIVPTLDGPVTTPRNDTHIVVTNMAGPTSRASRCASGRRR